MRQGPECPAARQAAGPTIPQAYLTDAGIRLGGPLCLALDRSRFFAREQAALTAAEAQVAAAQAALAAIPAGTATGPNPAAASAQQALNQARAALDTLPQERKIFIFIDGVKVPMDGHSVAIRPPAGGNEWALERIDLRGTEDASSDAGKAWREILGGPKQGGTRLVRIGVAVSESDADAPVMRALIRERATLRVYDPFWVMTGALGLILLAIGIGMSGWKTGLLRDGGAGTPFSLGRVQMAWWLVLTIGGFLFIWLVSGQWRFVMTSGTMALVGISATTGVAAQLVDSGTSAAKSVNFWADIVSDSGGAALHRIQLIAWTILLGGIFMWTVIWRFAFPDFDTNLLLLAGIAGGTYLGFKFQES
jgi:hypothetical protein